ncbi:MAG TPA: hypothetical protein VIL72_12640 [Beijerinckiaceae bacterium]|jgi:hypothetical protein
MRAVRSSRSALLRQGLFVLAVYAMLLQAFFGALAPAHAAPTGFSAAELCLDAAGPDAPHGPAHPHGASCPCAAACHVGGLALPPPPAPAAQAPARIVRVLAPPWSDLRPSAREGSVRPPVRGPPHAPIVVTG